jgi:hypothetical protein
MIHGRPLHRSGNDIREGFVIAISRFIERLACAVLAAALFAVLASCGSGAVGGNPPANDSLRVTILPGDGTVIYSGQPATFTLSGGTGAYIVSSSNPSVLPVDTAARNATSITVVANPVPADTAVTISVRDTSTALIATASVTVKPGTINNDILITPSSTQQSPGCPAATLCSGGDALVTVTLSQAGIALVGRLVRFDAVSGDFRFITSPTGTTPEILAITAFATTDGSGRASVRIRANADAPNQTAILQATDVSSGAFRQVGVVIAQSTGTSPGFFATPSSITFQGPNQGSCASSFATPGLAATFFIFGGVPPYTITSPSSGLVVSRDTVSFSGGSFDVRPTGVCLDNIPIVIRDSSGHTTTVTVSNVVGTTAVSPLDVSPAAVTLTSCSSTAVVTAVGGTGNYIGSSGSDAIFVNRIQTGFFQIGRGQNNGVAPGTGPFLVGVSDGQTTKNVTVTLSGQAAGVCPAPAFSVQPQAVTLTSCTGTASVILSGGSGVYSASSNSSAVKVTITGNTLSIGHNSGAAGTGVIVQASDGTTQIPINVTDNTGGCP